MAILRENNKKAPGEDEYKQGFLNMKEMIYMREFMNIVPCSGIKKESKKGTICPLCTLV